MLDSAQCLLYMLHHLGDKFTKRDSGDSLGYPELQWVAHGSCESVFTCTI